MYQSGLIMFILKIFCLSEVRRTNGANIQIGGPLVVDNGMLITALNTCAHYGVYIDWLLFCRICRK